VIASVAGFSNHKLMNEWILNPYYTVHHRQWWRMLTSGLLHANLMHLAVNMYVLYGFGSFLELYFKVYIGANATFYYLALYFLGIIAANISSVIRHKDDPGYNALGASGATSALVFANIVLNPWHGSIGLIFLPSGFSLPNIVFGALYLAYCVYMSKKGTDNIGHEAHFYGALWGAAFMLAVDPGLAQNFLQR
jgi:membrane associated rhomboid family serine protease